MDSKIEKSVTTQTKAIFPCHLNANDTLFGGEALKWMDEVAYITASRYAGKKMYTVYIDKIKFLKLIKKDDVVNVTGRVIKAGHVKLLVSVEITSENIITGEKERAITAEFTFAGLDDKGTPLILENELMSSYH